MNNAVAPIAPSVAAAAAPEGFDPELADIFKSEAAELLEVLDKSLAAWQADAHDDEALREIEAAASGAFVALADWERTR